MNTLVQIILFGSWAAAVICFANPIGRGDSAPFMPTTSMTRAALGDSIPGYIIAATRFAESIPPSYPVAFQLPDAAMDLPVHAFDQTYLYLSSLAPGFNAGVYTGRPSPAAKAAIERIGRRFGFLVVNDESPVDGRENAEIVGRFERTELLLFR